MNSRSRLLLISIVVQISLAFLFFNLIFNGHFHVSATRHLVFHAHPAPENDAENPIKTHLHSQFEFLFFQMLTLLLEQCVWLIFVWFEFYSGLFLKRPGVKIPGRTRCLRQPATRAPPLGLCCFV